MHIVNTTSLTEKQALAVWTTTLWSDRTTPIKSVSSMTLGGGTDMSVYNTPAYFWGVEGHGGIIGIISGHCVGNTFRTRGLWVDPAFRGQGLAQKLFKSAEDTAVELGCDILWSYPRHSALAAYTRFGFSVVSDEIIEEGNPYSPHFYVKKNLC